MAKSYFYYSFCYNILFINKNKLAKIFLKAIIKSNAIFISIFTIFYILIFVSTLFLVFIFIIILVAKLIKNKS